MLDTPILSKDVMYGVPLMYNQLRESFFNDTPPMNF
jgi:hypothetical protein